jgi:predicted nucleic acid-binding protein
VILLLDTNVLSELMRPEPAPAVQAWMARAPAAAFHVASISVAEILYGIARLPDGRRKEMLTEQAEAMFAVEFAERVLGFGMEAAPAYAAITAARERAGRPIAVQDAMIAAIASVHIATIATRDRDFHGCRVPVVDPWTA